MNVVIEANNLEEAVIAVFDLLCEEAEQNEALFPEEVAKQKMERIVTTAMLRASFEKR